MFSQASNPQWDGVNYFWFIFSPHWNGMNYFQFILNQPWHNLGALFEVFCTYVHRMSAQL